MSGARKQAAALRNVAVPVETCAATVCREPVKYGHLFCTNHWFFLPKWVRDAIWNTFIDGEVAEYQEAVRQAVDHIDAAFVAADERFPCHEGMGRIELHSVRAPDGSIKRMAGRLVR
jgi:hypothetical protein